MEQILILLWFNILFFLKPETVESPVNKIVPFPNIYVVGFRLRLRCASSKKGQRDTLVGG